MNDFIKGPIILMMYLLIGPALGTLVRSSRQGQRIVFGLMVFMTSWQINKFTLTFCSIETYRGHTKGFEASLIEVLSIALLVASVLNRPQTRNWRFWAPGAFLYLLYCAGSWLSILHALSPLYVLMAGTRFTKAVLIYLAAYHFIQGEEDVHWLLKSIAATLGVQVLVVLKMKYVDHFYQVHGWFEHQNPLAMWAYLCGLPLLAAAMADVSKANARWYTGGFIASAVIVEGSLSRASLLFFGVGAVLVVVFGLLDRITAKRIKFILGMGVTATIGLALALHTIVARFHDEGNEASGETRVVMNLAAKAMLHDSWLGIGWNNFAVAINSPYPYGDVIDDRERELGHKVDPDYAKGIAESHYWLLLGETGYPGFLSYLLFIGVTSWWCLRGMWRWRGTFSGVFLGGLLAGVTVTYVHSNLERVLTQTRNLSMWFILLGTAARIKTWRRLARR